MVNFEIEYDFDKDINENEKFNLQETAEFVVDTVLNNENCPVECEVELLVTDPETVREANKEYRNIDKTTDVLSFPNIDWNSPADYESEGFNDEFAYNPENGKLMLGQIVLNADRVVSQAGEYGHSVKREFSFLIAHSMLHLLGYDHMDEEDAKVMEKKQGDYLESIGITR